MDLSNLLHIYTLQYLFMPRIQECLQQFLSTWNDHKLRTEQHFSPLQILHDQVDFTATNIEEIDPELYGIDSDLEADDEEEVEVPLVHCDPIECPLNEVQLIEFKERVQPIDITQPFDSLTNIYLQALMVMNDIALRTDN